MLFALVLAIACHGSAELDDTGSETVDWSGSLPPLAAEVGAIRGFTPQRGIVHLHSPYSHDACDGDGLIDALDLDALALERAQAIQAALLVDASLTADRMVTDTASTSATITDEGWIPMKLELDASAIAKETLREVKEKMGLL